LAVDEAVERCRPTTRPRSAGDGRRQERDDRRERAGQTTSAATTQTAASTPGFASEPPSRATRRSSSPIRANPPDRDFVREPWPSPTTATELDEGLLDASLPMKIRSENPEHGTIFGDGIEADRIPLDWGQQVTIRPAAERLSLVA
jgi:hypothetical protein